jgi:multidrug resistance efflux pump
MQKMILPFFWLLALLALLKLGAAFHNKSEHFFGIVESQEQTISFQHPVEIMHTAVVPGINVTQGTPLLTVKRQELTSNQSILDAQIQQVELKKQEASHTLSSQIKNLTAKKNATLADLDYQIHGLELRIKQQAELQDSISDTQNTATPALPEVIKLNDLKKKRLYSAQAIQAELNNLITQANASNRPVDAQLAELHYSKSALTRQDTDLNVVAQFEGQISAVNYKAGELVPAFQTIMSLHSLTPRDIKGYIHESILNDVQIGQTVWFKSVNPGHNEQSLSGVVESLGNRIVEYPARLQVNPAVSAWGREVVIKLKPTHALFFGEKVQIFLSQPDTAFEWLKMFKPATIDLVITRH